LKYIFLCGIHGVGKSTLASKLKSFIDIKSFSVSDLIRKAGKKLDTSTKSTEGIQQNQDLWKKELLNLDINESILLLDGHFCLLDVAKNPTPLPFSIFDGTNMTKIIFVKNKPSVIRDRLEMINLTLLSY
jgi:adenylate kinase